MRRFDRPAALIDELARFQNEVRRLAIAAAHDICRQELERRFAAEAARAQPRRRRSNAPDPAAAAQAMATAVPGHVQLALPLALRMAPDAAASVPAEGRDGRDGDAAGDGPESGDAATAPAASPADLIRSTAMGAPANRKRASWTREAIIDELAGWILSGTVVDAAFVTRHGPKGLVAATRRLFGRFEAAMNVAGLHVSKLYPDGPPTRP
jgi:hypothetical protein